MRPVRFNFFILGIAFAALALCAGAARAAELTSFVADVDARVLTAGETLTFSLIIEADTDLNAIEPGIPNFGGLRVVAGPSPSMRQSMSIVNGSANQKFQKALTWELAAIKAGTYVIGESEVSFAGQIFRTLPITITVTADDNSALPPSLQNEQILHPRSRDRGVNQQIKGRVFVRGQASKTQPFVGEPVTVTYSFYFDPGLGPQSLSYLSQPDFTGTLSEVLFQAEGSWRFTEENIDGRVYRKVTLLQYAVTPTRPGPITLEGFSVRFRLPVRSNSVFDGAGGFGASVSVDAAAGPLRIDVKPLPDAGRPANFSGTVGVYDLSANVDRTEAVEGDIITLTLKLEGSGAISMAAPPEPVEMADFMIFDKVQNLEKWPPEKGLGGTKILELLLRPKRPGKLTIPSIAYSMFDPAAGQYKELKTRSFDVQVTPSQSDPARPVGVVGEGPPPELEGGLRAARPALDLRREAPSPVYESFFYWALQALAVGLAGGMYVRSLVLSRQDPREVRRARAWSVMEKKLAALQKEGLDREAVAGILEKALLEYLADRAGVRAEGLTRPDAAKLMEGEGLAYEKRARLMNILDTCSSVRFAPVGAGDSQFSDLAREALETLKEAEPS